MSRTHCGDTTIWEKTGKEMMRIPAGQFLFGEEKRERELPEFWIDRTPVTHAEYKRFLEANPGYPVPFATEGWAQPYNWDRQTRSFPPGKANHPVVLVAWYDVEAYAEWAGTRLPTEEEWEKAARGTDGRKYPWGRWERGVCNTYEVGIGTTTPVGQYSPAGDSPYGCVDMAGNVWEWTATQDAGDWVVRGGSFINDRFQARCAFHDWDLPDSGIRLYGFRLVASASTVSGYAAAGRLP
jgi:sulfatase modifying factor 1